MKKFTKDFSGSLGATQPCLSAAQTLPTYYIGENDSGWKIEGIIVEDHYCWVNKFIATHEKYGRIEGDYEDKLVGESEEAIEHFIKNHPMEEWDYMDN